MHMFEICDLENLGRLLTVGDVFLIVPFIPCRWRDEGRCGLDEENASLRGFVFACHV